MYTIKTLTWNQSFVYDMFQRHPLLKLVQMISTSQNLQPRRGGKDDVLIFHVKSFFLWSNLYVPVHAQCYVHCNSFSPVEAFIKYLHFKHLVKSRIGYWMFSTETHVHIYLTQIEILILIYTTVWWPSLNLTVSKFCYPSSLHLILGIFKCHF